MSDDLASVRVSVAALLRVFLPDGQGLVLVDARDRAFGPLGGVIGHHPDAAAALATFDWTPDRPPGLFGVYDLRGVLPAAKLPAFRAWFDAGAGRESGLECLRRELAEEMVEAGCEQLVGHLDGVGLVHALSVVEEPAPVAGKPYEQTRHFEIFDLDHERCERAARLQDELVALATDADVTTVVAATRDDVARGALGSTPIGTQTRHLISAARDDHDGTAVRMC